MPSIYELKKNLSLHKGEVLGGHFMVHDVEATMDEKKPRELYNFKIGVFLVPQHARSNKKGKQQQQQQQHRKSSPITASTNDLEDAKQALLQTAQERKIMYSSYGSPYEVHLEHVKATPAGKKQQTQQEEKEAEEGLIEVQALVVAKRRRDLPRLAEQEHGSSEDEEAAANDEMKRQGYRVVKAHFKSSHCPMCGSEFQPGQHIAKPQGEHSRGGWAHSTCLANRLEPVPEEEEH